MTPNGFVITSVLLRGTEAAVDEIESIRLILEQYSMRGNLLVATAAIAGALALAAPLNAAVITVNSVAPSWSAPVPNNGTVLLNQANGNFTDVRWGTNIGNGQSGLGFDPAMPPATAETSGVAFSLGQLRHYNNPIAGGSAIDQIDLTLSVVIAGAGTSTFSFRFLIDETTNSPPCPYPGNTACSDLISFQNLTTSASFNIGGQDYTLALIGFGSNVNSLQTSFVSEEASTNTTNLFAMFTAPTPPAVPEPMTLGLLGAGLIGLGAAARRRR